MRSKSNKPHPIAKDKAEKIFHRYICMRDKYTCFTCNRAGNQAGHYWHGKLDFDERNLHCQCKACNHFRNGNLAEYAHRLISLFGQEWFDKLNSDAHKMSNKFTIAELEEIRLKYKDKISRLTGSKNLPF